MDYLVFKVIHIAGIILLLGNIIVTAVWKTLADRTGENAVIAYAQRLVMLTDWIFTAGGTVLVLAGGYGMAFSAGYELWETTWLIWGQLLFIASGVIWLIVLIPTQVAQARAANAFAGGGDIPDSYWRQGRRWVFWGVLATILPVANLYFMVFKPI